MKNFSKLVFTSLFVLAVAPAFSQFSGGVDLGLPSGTPFSTVSSVGFGLSLRYEAPISGVDKLNWTATAGFISFAGKSYNLGGGFSGTYNSITAIPLMGGVKYYFQEANSGFYVAADLGLYLLSGGGASENRFGIAPGIGYRLEKWDFTARLNTPSDFNYLGFRAAYIFGGK